MYHAMVRRKLRHAFARINRGDYDSVIAEFHRRHVHVFHGQHALGGARDQMEETRRWYARLARIFPDLTFEIRSILTRGWPWSTVAVVEWIDRFAVDGAPFSNQGVHVLRLRWGKVTNLAIHCDTQRLADVLRRKAAAGLVEALAEPIGAPVPPAPRADGFDRRWRRVSTLAART